MPDVLFEKRSDGVAIVTLNRPDSMNAMGGELMPLLAAHLAECTQDSAVRCVVLSAAASEEVYFAAHGTYYSGECTGVVDRTASGVLACVAAGGQLAFSVSTASSNGTIACVFSSFPSAGEPNLVCQ